jgi:hypothetical protein
MSRPPQAHTLAAHRSEGNAGSLRSSAVESKIVRSPPGCPLAELYSVFRTRHTHPIEFQDAQDAGCE